MRRVAKRVSAGFDAVWRFVVGSPLPDSNRRPLPYHGSPARSRTALRLQKYLQRGRIGDTAVVGSAAQRSAPALPTECPGAWTTERVDDKQARGAGSPVSGAGREARKLPVLGPELLHVRWTRDVRVIGIHMLDGIDRVDTRESGVERGFDA